VVPSKEEDGAAHRGGQTSMRQQRHFIVGELRGWMVTAGKGS
jgi:hypothetical protein